MDAGSDKRAGNTLFIAKIMVVFLLSKLLPFLVKPPALLQVRGGAGAGGGGGSRMHGIPCHHVLPPAVSSSPNGVLRRFAHAKESPRLPVSALSRTARRRLRTNLLPSAPLPCRPAPQPPLQLNDADVRFSDIERRTQQEEKVVFAFAASLLAALGFCIVRLVAGAR